MPTFKEYVRKLEEAPHIEFANQFIDLEAETHHMIQRLKNIIKGKKVKDKYGAEFQLKSKKDIKDFLAKISKNSFVMRFLTKELLGESLLLEYVVPMGWSLEKWKAHKEKTNTSNKDYHLEHPDKKWKVVHGNKAGKVGEPIEGLNDISYDKASRAHKAIVISKGE